jgi:hypothetical protein
MSISSGERIKRVSDSLRNISHLAAEQNPSVDRDADPAPKRSAAVSALSGRQVFFRFSTRQFMFLLVTLSICFAVNRHNHFDDFIFLLALVVHPYSVIILMFVILPAWAIWMKVRPGRDPAFSCRPIPNGRVWGGSFASREVAIIELLKSISRAVSEQCPWRRARVVGKTFPADDNELQKSSAHATATRPKQYRR